METLQYKLQQFDPGIVWLDKKNIVTAINPVAMEVLGSLKSTSLGKEIIQFHPLKSREKIKMLLKESECPMDSPPPVTMMINAIDRLLMIKVSKMFGLDGVLGTCMVFYDLTNVAAGIAHDEKFQGSPLSLKKLPVYKNKRIILIDLDKIVYIKAEGHYSSLHTIDSDYLCNLSLADLEGTLGFDSFQRIHRSYIVNLDKVIEIEKQEKKLFLKMDITQKNIIPVSRNYQDYIKSFFNLS